VYVVVGLEVAVVLVFVLEIIEGVEERVEFEVVGIATITGVVVSASSNVLVIVGLIAEEVVLVELAGISIVVELENSKGSTVEVLKVARLSSDSIEEEDIITLEF
jgi:hypothetical protein